MKRTQNTQSSRSILAAAIISFTALVAASSTHAADVNWDAATDIFDDNDVSLNGTLIGAFNFAGGATTVNGVDFLAFPIAGPLNTVGNFTLSAGTLFSSDTSDPAAPFSTRSAGYQSLLGTGAVTISGTMTLTMSGLTVGENYEFQTWVNDSENATPPGFTFQVDVMGGSNTVTLDPNPSLAAGGLGQFVTGTFLANSTSQQITFSNSEVALSNGFQLRQVGGVVPEPGTLLFGLALIGPILSRRRPARE